jgi:hypothetical protein
MSAPIMPMGWKAAEIHPPLGKLRPKAKALRPTNPPRHLGCWFLNGKPPLCRRRLAVLWLRRAPFPKL